MGNIRTPHVPEHSEPVAPFPELPLRIRQLCAEGTSHSTPHDSMLGLEAVDRRPSREDWLEQTDCGQKTG